MNYPISLTEYKQQIADLYSTRSSTYDQSDWHVQIAHRLVEHAKISYGQQVLDIATGTGMVAIEAAQIVGDEGRVFAVDISTGMIDEARRKIEALGLNNIELILADAEQFNFPPNSCDRILCSSAFIWMSNLISSLKYWRQFLKPGGLIGFHAFAETAFVGGVVTRKVAQKYGISIPMNQPTGTFDKCHALLAQAGYEAIEIKSEQSGTYISLDQAKRMWLGSEHPAPGQFPNPLSQLSSEQLEQVKAEFEAELEALMTDKGIWNDVLIFYVFARKPLI